MRPARANRASDARSFHVKRDPASAAVNVARVPFMFDLDLGVPVDAERGQAIEHAVADAGAWPVRFTPGREERRWFGIRKAFPTVLEILTEDGRGHVLVRPDHWDEEAWELRADAVPRLASLVAIIAEHAPAEFEFRATWAGSPIERTTHLSVAELQRLVLDQRLNDHTRYRVHS